MPLTGSIIMFFQTRADTVGITKKGAGPAQKAKAEEHELGEIHTHTTEFAFPLPEKTKPVNHVILRGMDAEKQGSAKKGNWSAKVDKK